MKIIFLLFIISVCHARPMPPKQTAEIFNDVYRSGTDTPSASLEVTLTSTDLGIVQLPDDMSEGSMTDFSVTNILDSAYEDILTLTADMKQLQIINNSGGEFSLRVGATVKGVIAPGQGSLQPISGSTGEAIGIQSLSGTITSGKIYVNSFGE